MTAPKKTLRPVQVFVDDDGHYWADGEPIKNLPRLYTEDEVGEFFGVTIHTIRHWRKHGKIEFIKMDGTIRFTHQMLLDLLHDRTVNAWGREIPADSPLRAEVA